MSVIDVGFDTRPNLAGGIVATRRHHDGLLVLARRWLDNAAAARAMGDRAAAARALREAGVCRRRFYERTTPAPPPPDTTGWVWMPTLHDWLPRL